MYEDYSICVQIFPEIYTLEKSSTSVLLAHSNKYIQKINVLRNNK